MKMPVWPRCLCGNDVLITCINNIQFNTWDESKNDWKFDQDLSDRYIATEGMISYHGYH